jgi:hypothetical protein
VGRSIGTRLALFAVALILGMAWCTAAAPAALDFATGQRNVIVNKPIEDCWTNAKTALASALTNPFDAHDGSGQWIAYGPNDAYGKPASAAVVHCFPVGTGYVVTFTCAADVPPSLFTAAQLCSNISAVFLGKTSSAPLPTPTPIATGCNTQNLIGTWTWDDKGNVPFVFDAQNGITDNEGVSGNWNLSGNQATLTYYGTNTMTLSPDGKHLVAGKGVPRNFTRKC